MTMFNPAPTMFSSRPGRGQETRVHVARIMGCGAGRTTRTTKALKLPRNLVRGQGYLTASGLGYYVGTSRLGNHLFCFGRLPEFRQLCADFDRQFGSHVRSEAED